MFLFYHKMVKFFCFKISKICIYWLPENIFQTADASKCINHAIQPFFQQNQNWPQLVTQYLVIYQIAYHQMVRCGIMVFPILLKSMRKVVIIFERHSLSSRACFLCTTQMSSPLVVCLKIFINWLQKLNIKVQTTLLLSFFLSLNSRGLFLNQKNYIVYTLNTMANSS